jgi:hypothetical protein
MSSSSAEECTEVVVWKPPPWTDQQFQLIVGYVNGGASVPCACEASGVRWTTAQNWMRKGRAGFHPYVLFYDAMQQAKAMHEAASLLIISQEARGIPGKRHPNWKAAAWLDDRRRWLNARQRGEQEEELPTREATILVYPVPMPEGADPSDYPLMAGQAMTQKPSEGDDEP